MLDVGHNPAALLKLLKTLREKHPLNNFVIIYGTSKAKNSQESLSILSAFSNKIYLVQANHFRAK